MKSLALKKWFSSSDTHDTQWLRFPSFRVTRFEPSTASYAGSLRLKNAFTINEILLPSWLATLSPRFDITNHQDDDDAGCSLGVKWKRSGIKLSPWRKGGEGEGLIIFPFASIINLSLPAFPPLCAQILHATEAASLALYSAAWRRAVAERRLERSSNWFSVSFD